MYKKFISILLAFCLSLSCFCVPASAELSVIEKNTAKYYASLYDLITQYKNNEIDLNTLLNKSFNNYMDVSVNNTAASFVNIADIINSIGNLGFDVSTEWLEWNYEKGLGGSDDTLLNGHGAAVYVYTSSGKLDFAYYGKKGRISNLVNGVSFDFYLSYDLRRVYYSDGSYTEKDDISSILSSYYYNNSLYVLYGDWELSNGESIPDGLVTDLPAKQIPSFDDDSVSDDDLIDFLEGLLQDLMLQFPDLSTVEGLLRAILAKCTSIDVKMNQTGGGMDPAELSLLLDKSILSLTTQNKVNNDALLQELISIRETLQGYKDEEIPPEEANSILQGLISGITSGLLSFVGIELDVSEIVELCEDAGDLGISVLKGIVDIIAILNAAVPLQAVNALITTLTGIIFNLNEPTDLTFTLDGTDVVFLPVSLLSQPQIAGALNIIKGLVSIIVTYAWLKWARKFYLSQF